MGNSVLPYQVWVDLWKRFTSGENLLLKCGVCKRYIATEKKVISSFFVTKYKKRNRELCRLGIHKLEGGSVWAFMICSDCELKLKDLHKWDILNTYYGVSLRKLSRVS